MTYPIVTGIILLLALFVVIAAVTMATSIVPDYELKCNRIVGGISCSVRGKNFFHIRQFSDAELEPTP